MILIISAKLVELPNDTIVWLVYLTGDNCKLKVSKDRTWHGGVPFDAGPSLYEIKLYDDHTAKGDMDLEYMQPVAWFYTEEEANKYVEENRSKVVEYRKVLTSEVGSIELILTNGNKYSIDLSSLDWFYAYIFGNKCQVKLRADFNKV